eukprot:SAG31_NODE_4707_length_3019_cov_1.720205_2_plen_89_part_00
MSRCAAGGAGSHCARGCERRLPRHALAGAAAVGHLLCVVSDSNLGDEIPYDFQHFWRVPVLNVCCCSTRIYLPSPRCRPAARPPARAY